MPASLSESTRGLRAHESPNPSTMSIPRRMSGDGERVAAAGSPVESPGGGVVSEKSAAPFPVVSSAAKTKRAYATVEALKLPAPALSAENETEKAPTSPTNPPRPSPSQDPEKRSPPASAPSSRHQSHSRPHSHHRHPNHAHHAHNHRSHSHHSHHIPPRSGGSDSFIPPVVRSPTHISLGTEVSDSDEEAEPRYEGGLGWILVSFFFAHSTSHHMLFPVKPQN
jgi:hypothetical protein